MTEILINKFDNSSFLKLIKGLTYDKSTEEYTFNSKKYRLKSIVPPETKGWNSTFYFVNTETPTDIVKVLAIKDIPSFDGFNNVTISSNVRRSCYQHKYYKEITSIKRKEKVRVNKAIMQEQREAIAEQKRIAEEQRKLLLKKKKQEKWEAIQPIPCKHCGKLFKPTQRTQIFCSRDCYSKHSSHEQYLKLKESLRQKKECVVCGKEFMGTPRMKYCCNECYKKSYLKEYKNYENKKD